MSIKQVVGNYASSGSASVNISPTPENVIWIVAHQIAGSPQAITADAGNSVTPLGSAEEVGGCYVTQAVIESASMEPTVITSPAAGVIVAVEIDAVLGAPLATETGGRAAGTVTITGASSPYTLTGPSTGTLSGTPVLALAFGVNAQTDNDFSQAGSGFSALGVTWQSAPPAGMAMIESMTLTSDQAVAGSFAVTNQYDSYGVALATFAQAVPNPGIPFSQWNVPGDARGSASPVLLYGGPVVGYLSLTELYPLAVGTEGSVFIYDGWPGTLANQKIQIDVSEMTVGIPIKLPANIFRKYVTIVTPPGTKVAVKW